MAVQKIKLSKYEDQVQDSYFWLGIPHRSYVDTHCRFLENGNDHYRYGWSTDRVDGSYVSFVMKPVGRGARSFYGPSEWEVVSRKVVRHTTRAQARQRALKMYATAVGDLEPVKRDRRQRWECSECGKRELFYENDYICQVCRDKRNV